MKHVSTIEPDAPFLDVLAAELWRQTEGDGFRLSQYLILLPTRRACRHLGAAFARLSGGKAVLLPRLRPLGDIDEDEITFADEAGFDVPPAIAPLKRLMLLTQQVQKRDPSLSWDQAAQGAEALTKFLDQIQIEKCDTSQLPKLVEEQELATHWQQTILFLEIVTKNWPLILADQGCVDPAERRNMVLEAQAELWRKYPPAFPVIAAGSTGSIPATAELLDVVSGLPQGAVILPGLDRSIDNEAWDDVGDSHPQHSMKLLLQKLDVDRHDVVDWGQKRPSSARVRLLSECMRPANSTEAWRELRGQLGPQTVEGLTRLTLDHPQEEAQVIALRLREALETPGKTAAFVTPDRALAMRVAALLRRWGIDVDDSGGTPLSMMPIGTFMNLVLAAASPHAGVVDLLALLKHPFAACGMSTAACRAQAREAEMRVRKNEQGDFSCAKNILRALTDNWHRTLPLSQHIDAHIALAESCAASDTERGAARLWLGEAGENAVAWLDEWRESSEGFPPLPGSDYARLFGALSAAKTMRSAQATHPRLSVLGPLEARLIDADLIVLGGLNEGVWPPDVGFDPWMSRPMRKKFNLPSPEFRIGLSAHDFVQLASAREVMLTRASRVDGNPSVPSRFLLQVDTVLRAAGLSYDKYDALEPTMPWRAWAHALDTPQDIKACERPAPRPLLSARPTSLSVTEITTWLRNPYAIYAKHVLKLPKLEELDVELDASDHGVMIHGALEHFIRDFPQTLPPDAEAQLLAIGQRIFAQYKDKPRVQAFWWARFTHSVGWFIDQEYKRRAGHIRTLAVEPKGKILVDGLTLRGRADRIDLLPDGSICIIDYKTGALPTKIEVTTGIEPQLQLLALIASKGGFTDMGARLSGSLEYWSLKGSKGGGAIVNFTDEITDLVSMAEAGLKNLIASFADPDTPYEAVPKLRLQPKYNDYAHLSRLTEWGRNAGDGV